KGISETLLVRLFALVLLATSLRLAFAAWFGTGGSVGAHASPWLTGLGFVGGLASALFGVSGGVVFVPALTLLFGFGVSEAVSNSLVVVFPVAVFITWLRQSSLPVDFVMVQRLLVPALVGVVAGAFLVGVLSESLIMTGVALLLAVVAVRLVLKPPAAKRHGIE
ncbi:MAG: sulfite exporter TauE/SafE family protein, partial [Candidatus Micrarchaeota archaeon]